MAVHASGDGTVHSDPAANELEGANAENSQFHVHTLWKVCRYTRFAVG